MRPNLVLRQLTFRNVVDWVATLSVIVASGMVIATVAPRLIRPGPAEPTLPSDPVSLEGTPLMGNVSAKVVVIEFSDFQCPYCAKFSREVLPALKRRYIDAGRVALAFRHLPLTTIHSRAQPAALAADCAGSQGRFWEMHDILFANSPKLDDSDLRSYARSAGADPVTFGDCLDSGQGGRVTADAALATQLRLSGTPAFLIGVRTGGVVKVSKAFSGARAVGDFEKIFDDLLTTN